MLALFLGFTALFVSSCGDDDGTELAEASFVYEFHNGQTVAAAPYLGLHEGNLDATMKLEELTSGNTMITVTLSNTVDGATYHMHAHDAADATTTPNGTPYVETPNGDIFAQMLSGTGGSASISQETTMTVEELTETYEGFFVVHDPLQDVSTTDISTYIVVGAFGRTQASPDFESSDFTYDFNTGQLVEAFAYVGSHDTNLRAKINVTELADGTSRITATLDNTMDLVTYNMHAHDMADAATTPNGTPYIEEPNSAVFATSITGNGETAGHSSVSSMSHAEITTTYDGFFVVHDPLAALSTTDPTTYVILGVFAR